MVAQADYILGIDYGAKRIGVAIAHNIARLPRPFITLENNDGVLEALSTIISEQHIGLLVVGMPRSLDGQQRAQAAVVENFIAQLSESVTLPIAVVDETLSSVEAESLLKPLKAGAKIKKGDIDALAAALILERYFEEQPVARV